MRYLISESVVVVGRLPVGEVVSIEVYNLNTGLIEAVSTAICSEMGGSGLYRWQTSNLTSQPTAFTEYAYTMIDSLNNRYDGKFVLHEELYSTASDVFKQNLITNEV